MIQENGFFVSLSEYLHGFCRYIGSYFFDSPALPLESEKVSSDEVEEEAFLTRPVEELKHIIEQWVEECHYTDPELNLEKTLQQMKIPAYELNYYLNSVLCINGFRQWLPSLRIKEAKRLMLEKPNYTFDAIAEACGYSNRSTLSRSFKTLEGISPREWLKKNKLSDKVKDNIEGRDL